MSLSDPISDMITRIRNGQRARKAAVDSPASQLREQVLEALKREGYIRGYTREETKPGIAKLRIELKYHQGEPVIREIDRISRPGRKVYSRVKDMKRVHGGLGVAILSTSKGVMSDTEARAANLGGEVLCQVF